MPEDMLLRGGRVINAEVQDAAGGSPVHGRAGAQPRGGHGMPRTTLPPHSSV